MIIVKLQGGLGNQLFQYALGRSLAAKTGSKVKFDNSWYGSQTYRNFELEQFNVDVELATPSEVRSLLKYRPKKRKIWFLYNWLIADTQKYIREPGADFDPKILSIKDNAYLDGIWLSQKYFAGVESLLRRQYTLKHPLPAVTEKIQASMRETNSVSICIRRGDFVTDKKVADIHGLLPLSFFHESAELIAKKVPNPHFFVFSDDIAWVRDNFKLPYPMTFVSDGHQDITGYHELVLMSMCKHNINANSSFSWWASWLNANPQKIVIFPAKWFKQESRNSADQIPPEWIKLEVKHL